MAAPLFLVSSYIVTIAHSYYATTANFISSLTSRPCLDFPRFRPLTTAAAAELHGVSGWLLPLVREQHVRLEDRLPLFSEEGACDPYVAWAQSRHAEGGRRLSRLARRGDDRPCRAVPMH